MLARRIIFTPRKRRKRVTRIAACAAACVWFASATSSAEEPTQTTSAPTQTFQTARADYLAGRYEQAIETYDALSKQTPNAVKAACGRSRIDLMLGDYAAGIERLEKVKDAGENSADWHVCLAELLCEIGDYDAAISHNRLALAIDDQHHRAHWQLGQAYELRGKTRDAVAAYELFEDIMTFGPLPDTPEAMVYIGSGFYRYTVLTRHENISHRTRHVLTEVFQDACDNMDADYWPARLAGAELLLEKHNADEAQIDLEEILEQNPRVPDAMVGLGRIHLESMAFEKTEELVNAALAVNPNHIGAMLLLANSRMLEDRYAEAAPIVERALKINPNSVAAIGLLAAARQRSGDVAAVAPLLERATRINAKPAEFHYALGVWLSDGRQFDDAEIHFKQAIELAPTWTEPRTDLGLLYMDTGEEKKARTTLEASFKLDSFNARTHRVLTLLDQLDKFARIETGHFIVKYDASEDAIVAPYVSEALEAMHDEICKPLGHTPKKRTIVEMFPYHHDFSVRVTGRPFICTIGACTGRVIAITAPRNSTPFGEYNWVTVLRHEFVHTVTLDATLNRIPHWFTEGLAVSEEPAPRRWEVRQLLSKVVQEKRLFPVDQLNWGFIRPQRMIDRMLAYAQSEWMVEYIRHRWGDETIKRLLAAFREGKSQQQAFDAVLQIEPATFDSDFAAWARQEVKIWGMPATAEDADALSAEIEKRPDDADLLARVARTKLANGEMKQAEAAARKSLKQDRNQKIALETLCIILIEDMLSASNTDERLNLIDEAEIYARRLNKLDPENPRAIKYLGYAAQAWEGYEEAIAWYRKYKSKCPADPDTYRRLFAIYNEAGDEPAATKQLESLFFLLDDDDAIARTIAERHAEASRTPQAIQWRLKSLQINPYDFDTHFALAEEALAAGQHLIAERGFTAITLLRPDAPDGYDGLARVYSAQGNHEKAATYEKKAAALRQTTEAQPPDDAMTH